MRRIVESPLWEGIWAALVLLLPITSMPFVVKLARSDVVAAPSGLLLPIILAGWAVPMLTLRQRLPRPMLPAIVFVLMALFSAAISFFRPIPFYKNISPISPTISAILTLFIGVGFYALSLLWHERAERKRNTLRLINYSGLIILIWTLMQAFFWYSRHRYPQWMKEIQFFLSIGSLYRQRFVGFTLEPSWLAHQLNLLYLPWWFAASISGTTVERFRWRGLTLERLLFIVGGIVLFLTLSRVGLAAFLLTGVWFMISSGKKWLRDLSERSLRNYRPTRRGGAISRKVVSAAFMALAGAAVFGAIWLMLFALSKLDYRMANLFQLNAQGRSDPLMYIAEKLSLAARFVYWDAGISLFNRYPLFGAGLGHAGFYLPDLLNSYALRLPEVRALLYHSLTLLNIKSLWIRILAETGIGGFACFCAWLLYCWRAASIHRRSMDRFNIALGWMGQFILIAFLLEGFSVDTFALPYFWFGIGLVCGNDQ